MSFYPPEQLTGLLRVHFDDLFRIHFVKILAPEENSMVIQVNEPWFIHFKNEDTMFGKAIRLLWHMQQKKNLLTILALYDIKLVTVTEAFTSQDCNASNTAILKFEFIKMIFDQLAFIATKYGEQKLEQAFVSLINENKGR